MITVLLKQKNRQVNASRYETAGLYLRDTNTSCEKWQWLNCLSIRTLNTRFVRHRHVHCGHHCLRQNLAPGCIRGWASPSHCSCVNGTRLTQQQHLTDAVSALARMANKSQEHTRLSAPDCTLNELAKSSDFTWLVIRWYISDAISRTLDICKTTNRTLYNLKCMGL